MVNPVANPRTTFNIVTRDQILGLEDQRALIVAQITAAGSAADGDLIEVPRTAAEINSLFGAASHAALLARRFRKVNPYTNLDVKCLDDDGAATKGTAEIVFGGAATGTGEWYITVVDGHDHRYQIEVASGEGPDDVLTKLAARVANDAEKPFSYTDDATDTATFTAANGGSICNNWPLIIEGRVPGMTATLTGWAGGATDPDVSTVFDDLANIRYQTVIWPESYPYATLRSFLDPRKNVDNDVKDGRGFVCLNDTFANLKTTVNTNNSSEIVWMGNEPTNTADWKGPHLPEAPDLSATYFAAVRALRFEDGISISHVVTTNEPDDQFGGIETCTLPYFNTPFVYTRQPRRGSGFTYAELLELEDAGFSVIGSNRANTGVVAGQMVTGWLTDEAGNPDDTWKFLNWRDSHGVIREFYVVNFRKEFAQHRLTTGSPVPGRAIATEPHLRAYWMELYDFLAARAITIDSEEARQHAKDTLSVQITLAERQAQLSGDIPMVSQLGNIIGTIKFSFDV